MAGAAGAAVGRVVVKGVGGGGEGRRMTVVGVEMKCVSHVRT